MSAPLLPFCSSNDPQLKQPFVVLAIEDNPDSLLLLNYALEMFGCTFLGEVDGKSGLAAAKRHQPDLILLDVILPDCNGIDLMQQLRQDPQTCHIPVIAVTALASADDRQELLAEGFTGYLSKPYMIDDLEAAVRRYAGG